MTTQNLELTNASQFVDRTFYCKEKKRIVTVSYSYDRINKVLMYGASIFNQEHDCKDVFNKKTHRQTAMNRLSKRPVIIGNVFDTSSLDIFHEKIRNYIYKYGVRGQRL